jgi:2-polyprenyl-6-methoxyphenol hydroxylase-like FAD-dependent oxidoreductase
MHRVQVPVLIVGGGPVGLVASVCLSRLGVRSLLIERHPGTTIHPKARNLNLRTMEIVRPWGIDAELAQGALPHSWTGCFVYATTLAGRELGRMQTRSFESERTSELTPVTGILSSQDVYEPVIRRFAERLGPGELRFHHELEELTIDEDRARARVRSLDDGSALEVESRFVLACDGWSSTVRNGLGIPMEGPSAIGHFVNVYFRADLSRWTEHRPAVLYFVASDDARGVFQPLDGRGRWLCQISYDGSETAFASYTAERCLDWIRRAVGTPDVEAEILSIGTWTMNATVAAALRHGPVFLCGDAAHQLPPTGGFGMNTGVQDVHNLAWKIAGVLAGWAGSELLSSYDLERRPVARINADRSLENSRMVGRINRTAMEGGGDSQAAVAASRRYGNFMGMDLGFRYEQGAFIPDGSAPPEVADPVIDYAPTARPGHRAPHVRLVHEGRAISTLDLFDSSFTMLAGASGREWCDAARAVARTLGAPLEAFTVGPRGDLRDSGGGWHDLYGVGPEGAVLVRPDGHVGWRSARAIDARAAELERALRRILSR